MRLISTRICAIALTPILLALLFTQTRASIIALIIATAFLIGRKYYKLLIPATLICLLIVAITTTTRQIDNLPLINQLTSDRIYLWEIATKAISQRPLKGWGFDGFGSAYPYIVAPNNIQKTVRQGDFSIDYIDKKGQLRTLALPTVKAHNLILDTTISVGILGLLSYCALIVFAIKQTIHSPVRDILAVASAYFIFTFTWFECAQFTHIVWWALSLWGLGTEKEDTETFSLSASSQSPIPFNSELPQTARIPAVFTPNRKRLTFKLISIASSLLLATFGIYYLTNPLHIKATSSIASCGSTSGGPTDNPIALKYGDSAYSIKHPLFKM